MTEFTLYGQPPSTFVRTVRLVAAEKGLRYRMEPANAPGAPRHPYGVVPVIRHGDFVLYETPAIARYLDRVSGGTPLVPADAQGAARVDQWVSIACDYVYRDVVRGVLLPRFGFLKRPEADVQESLARIAKHLEPIEESLGKHRYLAGEHLTLADLFILPLLFFFPALPELKAIGDKGWPNIGRWWKEMAAKSSVKETEPQLPQKAAATG
jgi:glutathione S-transferase